ncbi:NnrS family protein [Sphingomonas rhizophila]|uniref:NnrS family protein n=1 Tax=Sphingomonas rhizophila TaxID=2071607 RepID=A0A7G9S9X6_9SPHN|nr:NnrS family protein [Sphingomonas rhizophila]
MSWHRHEMLFGYLGAVIAGFLLTAVPNWTGRLPIAGGQLASLALLWVTARAAMFFSASTGAAIAALLDVGFLLVLALVCAREVLIARNRNVPVVGAVLLLALASAADHAEAAQLLASDGAGWRAGFAIVLLLIALIGGRIIPSFTANWLIKQGQARLPRQPSTFDFATIGVTAVGLGCWVFGVAAGWGAALLIGAGLLQIVRLARWQGLRTTADPLVFILHLSYAWLPLGLVLLGMSLLVPTQPTSSALHAMAAGAMASMTLAVMTRATLGHTGRKLHADFGTTCIYLLVTLGAATRVAAPWLPFDYMLSIQLSGALWAVRSCCSWSCTVPSSLDRDPTASRDRGRAAQGAARCQSCLTSTMESRSRPSATQPFALGAVGSARPFAPIRSSSPVQPRSRPSFSAASSSAARPGAAWLNSKVTKSSSASTSPWRIRSPRR